MRVVERRLRNLESRFQTILQSIKDAADPYSDQTIIMLLAAGEWEFTMKLLDCMKRGCEPSELAPMPKLKPAPIIDPSNLSAAIREVFDVSLAHLTQEQRHELAWALFEADPDNRKRAGRPPVS